MDQEDQMALEKVLQGFLQKSESLQAAILDKGGNLFVQCGTSSAMDLPILAALAAGAFAATRELAKRLGESEFTALYHEGRGISILMSALEFDALLVTVFNQNTNLGLVKFHTQETARLVNDVLRLVDKKSTGGAPLEIQMDDQNLNKPIF